jgi:multimeric flavodoxin WrbA
MQCRKEGASGCIFKDELYNNFVEKMQTADGVIIGSPVYYAGPAGSLCAILDRVCFSAAKYFRHKPAACMVNCRRGGASAAFDRLNKYFSLLQMPIATSSYWNSTHGTNPQEVVRDLEGMQVIRTLARNMAYLLKSKAESGVQLPEQEEKVSTNFIS